MNLNSRTIRMLKDRNTKNKNWVMMIVGETGDGKSWTAYKIGEDYDPGFDYTRFCFEPTQFMRAVKELPSGSVMVYDDAGVTFSASNFWEEVNMIIGWTLQSFRYRIVNLIFTMPASVLLDRKGRISAHYKLSLMRQGYGRLYRMKWDDNRQKMYTPRLWDIKIGPPANMDGVRAYEEAKQTWLEETYGDYLTILENKKRQTKIQMAQQSSPEDLASKIINDLARYKNDKGVIEVTSPKIQAHLGIGTKKAYAVRALVIEHIDRKKRGQV